jgi:hypothetical protein
MTMRILVVATLAVLLGGCNPFTGIGDPPVYGFIGYPDDLAIVMPDAVATGQQFTVTVRTRGADGCWQKDRTQVTRSGLEATITPFDVRRGGTCTMAPVEILHTATLMFAQAGVATVTILGRDGTAQRSVVVQ